MKIPSNEKLILIDNGSLMFRAIFGWQQNKTLPATWIYLRSLFSCLKHFNLHPDDKIVIAVDSAKGSWRREVDSDYKANRKENREKHKDIDWNKMFNSFNSLLARLNSATPFLIINIDKLEADDIIAHICKTSTDCKEIIVVSSDSDMEQLAVHPNVKIFSPVSKKFKSIANPYHLLSKKIESEVTDNLISPILTNEDYERRLKIVSLLNLPQEVEEKIDRELSSIDFDKEYNIQFIPFRFSKTFMDIYNNPIKIKEKKVKKILQKSLK